MKKMKKMKFFVVAIITLFLINSCTKSGSSPSTSDNLEDKISAKWNVENSSQYESVEFNKSGNYIIVPKIQTRSPKEVLYGIYEIVDGKIILSNLGTITVEKVDGKSISLTLKLTSNPSEEIKLDATKQEEMQSNSTVDLLCRTWVATTMTVNGNVTSYPSDSLTVLFSKAGTYFVSQRAKPSYWKLKDNNKILYYHPEGQTGFDDNRFAIIKEITSSKLVIEESREGYNNITELKPFKR